MSWKAILKRKRSQGITDTYKNILDSIMTNTPKSGRAIRDMLYDEVDRLNATRKYRISRLYMPSPTELSQYFKMNSNKYGTKILNSKGKEVENKKSGIMHYYKL